MISNFPDGFKTVRIFPDDCQFSGLFQNYPDFTRWLPIFRIFSKLSGFSRWLPIFWIISKLSGFFQMTDSIAYSLFVDVFYRPTCTFVNSFHLRAAHFRLDTIVQWRSGKLLLRDPGTAMASTPSETTQWPIQERIYWLTSPQSQRWRKQTETFVFVVTVLRCQLKKSKCVVGLSRDGRNVSNQVL